MNYHIWSKYWGLSKHDTSWDKKKKKSRGRQERQEMMNVGPIK